MAQSAAPRCDICKGDIANVFCYECRNFLCKSCNSCHERFPATKRHTVTDSHSVDRSILMLTTVCEHHHIEFTYYCRDSECLICAQCVTSLHKGHSITDTAEIAAEARANVKKRVELIEHNIKILSDSIEAFKTTKQAKLQTSAENFCTKVNEVSQDLIRIIESITEINLTHASDFHVLEKQHLLYNLAKLEKSYSEYHSMHDRYEQILRDKHDVTFFLNQKSLSKEYELIDDIPLPDEPKEIESFKTNDFVDSVIRRIDSKYELRCV